MRLRLASLLVVFACLCLSPRSVPAQTQAQPAVAKPELVIQTGHSGSFMGDVAFGPDGRWLASSGDDAVKIWDVATGRELRAFKGKGSVAISPDGKWLAVEGEKIIQLLEVASGRELRTLQVPYPWTVANIAISPDGRWLAAACLTTIKIWEVATGRELQSLVYPTSVSGLAISPDGRWVVGTTGTTFKAWEAATGREVRTWVGHGGDRHDLPSLTFSPDGSLLASAGGADKTVKLWDTATWQELRTLVGHTGLVNGLAFSPDGRSFASASWDKTIKIWDVTTGRELRALTGHATGVDAVAFSRDGRLLVSGSLDKTVMLWDVAKGSEVRAVGGVAESTTALAASAPAPQALPQANSSQQPFAKDAPGATPNTSVTLAPPVKPVPAAPSARVPQAEPKIDISQRAQAGAARPELVVQTGHESYTFITNVAFSPDGRWLASGAGDAVRIWDVAAARELRSFESKGKLAISPDGKWLAVSGEGDKVIQLLEAATGRVLQILQVPSSPVIHTIAISPDGKWLAASTLKTIQIWDSATGRELQTLPAGVTGLAISPDGRWIVGASGTTFKVWEAATGREVRTWVGHGGDWKDVPSLAFSPDGRLLASAGGADKRIQLWDTTTWQEVRTLAGHPAYVGHVAFSPDGRLLASASMDMTVKIWEVATGRELRTLTGHTKWVQAVAFSPDGRLLVSTGQDRSMRLWELATGRQLRGFVARTDVTYQVAFSPTGDSFFTGGMTEIKKWDARAGRYLSSVECPSELVTFSPDRRLAAWQWDNDTDHRIKLVDLASGRELRTLPGHGARVLRWAFDTNSRLMATLSANRSIKIWDLATGGERRAIFGVPVREIAFSPDGRTLAGAGEGKYVVFWDVATGNQLRTIDIGASGIFSIAFSPDGRLLATSYESERKFYTELWDLAAARKVHTLDAEWAWLRFSSDSRLLATSGLDGTKLWDVTTGRQIWAKMTDRRSPFLSLSPDNRHVLSGSGGGLDIRDVETGQTLARVVSMTGGLEWLVVTPDGLFDGSPAAWGQILWRFNNNTFDVAPAEAFFNEYYYPGLLAEILAGRRPKATVDIASKDRRQPQLTLIQTGVSAAASSAAAPGKAPAKAPAKAPSATAAPTAGQPAVVTPTSSRTVKVRLDVAEGPADAQRKTGSGVRDVRLFRNGSLVKVWRGDLKLDAQGKAVLEATVPIVAGENRFTAYAFNHDNIKSSDATLTVTGADALKRAGTAYVLAVGINKYANADYNLNFAVADATAMAEELTRQQEKLGTFGKIEVVPLLDQQATKANLLLALERLAGTKTGALPAGTPAALAKLAPAQPEDAVFVYFAGHGVAHGARFYLLPHDLGYTGGRTAVDKAGFDAILAHGVSDLELIQAFEKVDARQLVLIIDACNSGQALEAEEKRRGPMNSKGLAQLAYEKGMYILAAAQGYQAALETAQLGHGILTYALVEEGLKTPAADTAPKDQQVALREWLDYATDRVPQMQEAAMKAGAQRGVIVYFVEGEKQVKETEKRSLQRPRVFYRREPESTPLVVAKP